MFGFVHMRADAHRSQKCWIPLDFEFLKVVSILMRLLGSEFRSSVEQYKLLTLETSFNPIFTPSAKINFLMKGKRK